jgi:hypothetical protein
MIQRPEDYWDYVVMGIIGGILVTTMAVGKVCDFLSLKFLASFKMLLRLPTYPLYRLGRFLETSEKFEQWVNQK